MPDNPKLPRLPKGATEVPSDGPIKIGEAQVISEGHEFLMMTPPEFQGVLVQVQHPAGHSELSKEPGLIGMTVSTIRGRPVPLINIRHADGTGLMAILSLEDFAAVGELWSQTMDQAVTIERTRGGTEQ